MMIQRVKAHTGKVGYAHGGKRQLILVVVSDKRTQLIFIAVVSFIKRNICDCSRTRRNIEFEEYHGKHQRSTNTKKIRL